MRREADYVLGTHDDEVARLAVQHRVWRSRVWTAWNRAGFARGHTVLDVGCGPGYAAMDLAHLVGPTGQVVAVDRSRRFLEVLETATSQRGIDNVVTHEIDLDSGQFPGIAADGAWCRWIFTFVERPHELLERVAATLKPGGVLVVHEYFDYGAWRTSPPCPELEEFVAAVMGSWRDAGGDPDVGLSLQGWLLDLGFTIEARPIVEIVRPSDPKWLWLRTFVQTGRTRLTDLGHLIPTRAEAIWQAFTAAEQESGTLMVTPGVLEIVARRR